MEIEKEEDEVLSEIAKHSHRLNDQATRSSEYIDEIERRMKAMGVGISVWTDHGLLGYDKVKGRRRIAYISTKDGEGAGCPPTRCILRDADRHTRLKLVTKIPALLKKILDAMKEIADEQDEHRMD